MSARTIHARSDGRLLVDPYSGKFTTESALIAPSLQFLISLAYFEFFESLRWAFKGSPPRLEGLRGTQRVHSRTVRALHGNSLTPSSWPSNPSTPRLRPREEHESDSVRRASRHTHQCM